MLRTALMPYRSARSLGRILIAALAVNIPVAGTLWFSGWLLDHQRSIAWDLTTESPDLTVSSERFGTGLWVAAIQLVWSLPVTVAFEILGLGLLFARVTGPISQELLAIAGTPNQDPLVIQQRITVVMTDSVMPAVGVLMVLTLLGAAVVRPFVLAAVTRFNLYRTSREGFALRAVWNTLASGGGETLKAAGFALLPTLIQIPALLWAWHHLSQAVVLVGPTASLGDLTRVASGFGWFWMITTLSSTLTVLLEVAVYGAWGVWARDVYGPQLPASSAD